MFCLEVWKESLLEIQIIDKLEKVHYRFELAYRWMEGCLAVVWVSVYSDFKANSSSFDSNFDCSNSIVVLIVFEIAWKAWDKACWYGRCTICIKLSWRRTTVLIDWLLIEDHHRPLRVISNGKKLKGIERDNVPSCLVAESKSIMSKYNLPLRKGILTEKWPLSTWPPPCLCFCQPSTLY